MRFYRILSKVFPRAFRRDFEHELEAVAADMLQAEGARAAIGLYGVLSFDVAQQRRELGVRAALGATASSIRRLVLARGFRLVGFGLAAGVVLAMAASRSISELLFQAPATDTVAFVVAAGTLALTAGVAIWFPARRASRADPIETLRS